MSDATVATFECRGELLLQEGSVVEALVEVLVLHEFEHDVRVDGVGVKAVVFSLVICFEFDNGVFSHSDVEVFVQSVGTENEGLCSFGLWHGRGVGMDADKEVRVVFIHEVRPFLEWDEDICLSCIEDFDFGEVGFDELSGEQRDGEVQVFLLRQCSYCSGVGAAVSGVDDDDKGFVVVRGSYAGGYAEE